VGVLSLVLAVGDVPVLLELTARRGNDTYTVLYESGPALRGRTHVAAHLAGS
jgi:hypothetical protein